jgi:hypothetical protein
MLALTTLGIVMTAVAIIGAVVAWGARHRTLRESDQERFDRLFDQIVAYSATAGGPGPPTIHLP